MNLNLFICPQPHTDTDTISRFKLTRLKDHDFRKESMHIPVRQYVSNVEKFNDLDCHQFIQRVTFVCL